MNYTSLTDAQRKQVAFLFCDEIFHTDPSEYEYELTGETVTGRSRIAQKDGAEAIHAKKARKVQVSITVNVIATEDGQRAAAMTIKELARAIVARMIQVQPQEA
jgi:hypothetical protein